MTTSNLAVPVRFRPLVRCGIALGLALGLGACAHTGRLALVEQTITPADTTGGHHPERSVRHTSAAPLHALMTADTLIGFKAGTGDSAKRYLGRLRDGYTADTLNVILLGDNRPGFRSTRLQPQIATIRKGLSLNPIRIGKALITIPYALVKGLWPDLGIIQDAPRLVTNNPKWGREHQVLHAVMARMDTLKAQGRIVATAINTGDLVYDGRDPRHWERFIRIWSPLTARVPYFAVAGNHEKTWDQTGLANWRTATGLPIAGDRMYYCFDSADGWVRFIALDTNPITMPGVHWSKDVQVEYSKEQVDWLTARIKEHEGPALVFMHSPPFSAGYHRMDWDMDDVMRARRSQIVKAIHDAGIGVLVAGHDHNYQRALLTWPDGSVLITMVQGGAGAPLHPLPPPAQAASMIAATKVAGSTIKPENVYTAVINNYTLLRLWFGGGELQTYAVKNDGSTQLADQVKIDLERYGRPKIDQFKVPIAQTSKAQPSRMEAQAKAGIAAKADTTAPSARIETGRPPGKKKSIAANKASRAATAKKKPATTKRPTRPAPTASAPTHTH